MLSNPIISSSTVCLSGAQFYKRVVEAALSDFLFTWVYQMLNASQ